MSHRISADFHDAAYRDLEELARSKGKTKAEILRDAIALEKWFWTAVNDGHRILVEREDGSIREVIPR